MATSHNGKPNFANNKQFVEIDSIFTKTFGCVGDNLNERKHTRY